MKLWEVLKALDENSKKKFMHESGNRKVFFSMKDGYFRFDVYYNGKLIAPELGGGGFNDNIRGSLDWQEVKQPVTWQEAIEAWTDGKTIRCEDGVFDYLFSGGKNTLTDSVGAIDKYQITKGTWYIED